MALKYLLDEHLRGPLWLAIQRHNAHGIDPIDVVRVGDIDAPTFGSTDPEILQWAEQADRLLITLDEHTIPRHFIEHLNAGHHVPGILTIPDGYEVYEEPCVGGVSLRRIRPSRILPAESEQLTKWVREFGQIEYFVIEVEVDRLVLYRPHAKCGPLMQPLHYWIGACDEDGNYVATALDGAFFPPRFRFQLVDESLRLFTVEGWHLVKDPIPKWWWHLADAAPLESQAKTYLPFVNGENIDDLP